MSAKSKRNILYQSKINKSMKKITEAFISFYGEQEREQIIEKFNNIGIGR